MSNCDRSDGEGGCMLRSKIHEDLQDSWRIETKPNMILGPMCLRAGQQEMSISSSCNQ